MYFLISALVSMGAITSPMMTMTTTEMMAVTLVLVMFCSACSSDSFEKKTVESMVS